MLINKPLKNFLKSFTIFSIVMCGAKLYTMFVGEPVINSSVHLFIQILLVSIPYSIFLLLMLYVTVRLVVDFLCFLTNEAYETLGIDDKGEDDNEW